MKASRYSWNSLIQMNIYSEYLGVNLGVFDPKKAFVIAWLAALKIKFDPPIHTEAISDSI